MEEEAARRRDNHAALERAHWEGRHAKEAARPYNTTRSYFYKQKQWKVSYMCLLLFRVQLANLHLLLGILRCASLR
jgi:hypothetical protein